MFDVSTAFLTGQEIGRGIYGPKDGLPAVGKVPKLKPWALLELLKGGSGLLWDLQAMHDLAITQYGRGLGPDRDAVPRGGEQLLGREEGGAPPLSR